MRIIYFLIPLIIISCEENGDANDNCISGAHQEDSIVEHNTVDTLEWYEEVTYYPTGQIKDYLRHNLDSSYGFHGKTYYPNGNLMREYQLGEFEGCGIQTGEEIIFDSLGSMIEIISFEHSIDDDGDGCHDTRSVISKSVFYSNGKTKMSSYIETCYECQECPCGTWVYFDSTGVITKKEQYEDCYDGKLDCL